MEQTALERLPEVNVAKAKAGLLQTRVATSKTNKLSPSGNSRASGSGVIVSRRSSAHAASEHNCECSTHDEDEDRNGGGSPEHSFSLGLLKPPPFDCSASLGDLNECQMPAGQPSLGEPFHTLEYEPAHSVESLRANSLADFEDAEEMDTDHTMNRQVPTQSGLEPRVEWNDSIPHTQDPVEAAMQSDAARMDTRRHSADGEHPSPLAWPMPRAESPVERSENDGPALPNQAIESTQSDSMSAHGMIDATIAEDSQSSERVSDRVNGDAQSLEPDKTRLLDREQRSRHSKDAQAIMEGHVADTTSPFQNNRTGTQHVYTQDAATRPKMFEDLEKFVNAACAKEQSCVLSCIGATDQLATHIFSGLTWSADEVATFEQSEILPVYPGDERTPDHMKGLLCKVVACAKRESIQSCIQKDVKVLASDLVTTDQTRVIFIFDLFGKSLYPGQRSYLVIPSEFLDLHSIATSLVRGSGSDQGIAGTSGGWIDLQSLVQHSILHFSCQGRNIRDLLFKIHQELPANTGFKGTLQWKIGDMICRQNYIATISAGRELASAARPVTSPFEWPNQTITHARLDDGESESTGLDLPSANDQTTESEEDQSSASEAPNQLTADAENESAFESCSDYETNQTTGGIIHSRQHSNATIANPSKAWGPPGARR